MPALTLPEAAKLAANNGETKKAGIISLYAEKSDILAVIPVDGIMGSAYSFTQEGDLPATAFRGVNEGFTPSTGTFNPQIEALFAAGGDLDVDRFIVKTQGEEARSKHEGLKVKSLSANITDTIITGDNSSEPREFNGLQVRCTGDQLIAQGSTSGGDTLTLAKLDELLDTVNGATHLIMSRAMRRLFQTAARSPTVTNNQVTDDMDSDLGRRVTRYQGIPILTGYERTKNTGILPFSEANPGGGSAVGTSIYAVNFRAEDGFTLISNGGIDVRDLGELEDKPAYRTRVEWYVGSAQQSPYCAARLWGIKTGAIA